MWKQGGVLFKSVEGIMRFVLYFKSIGEVKWEGTDLTRQHGKSKKEEKRT